MDARGLIIRIESMEIVRLSKMSGVSRQAIYNIIKNGRCRYSTYIKLEKAINEYFQPSE